MNMIGHVYLFECVLLDILVSHLREMHSSGRFIGGGGGGFLGLQVPPGP